VLFFGAASVANAQIVNIPDANFKVAFQFFGRRIKAF
jgi:hypothetical protein